MFDKCLHPGSNLQVAPLLQRLTHWAASTDEKLKSVQSALSDLKRPAERLQSQCNYRPFIT